MIFSQPGFLWALAALTIPVLIHLFNFQKTERITFANTRVLQEVIQQTQKSRQVKNWFLLFIRLLAFSFLILAFAQPQIIKDSSSGIKALPQATVYLDNSVSMFASKDGKNAYENAVGAAKTIPKRYTEKGWFQLLTNSFESKHSWTSPSGFLDQLTEAINPSQSRELGLVVERTNRQLNFQNLGDQKIAYLISDFQKSNVGPLEKLKFDSTKQYNFVHIAQEEQANAWVDSVWLPKPISLKNESQEIRVKIARSGSPLKRKINLQLFADGNLISGKIINPMDQNSIVVSLPFRIKSKELKRCTLQTDDPEITFDNNFYFKLESPPPSFVYIISEKKNRFLLNAMANKDLFQVMESGPNSIDYQKLIKADLVILDGLTNIEESLKEACKKNGDAGKSILVFPGKNSESLKGTLATEGISTESASETKKAQDWLIKLPEKGNAFFGNAFKEISQSAIKPFAQPNLIARNGNSILKYENGMPYLSLFPWKKGNLFLASGQILENESSLQNHPLIIPLLYNIVFQSVATDNGALFSRISQSSYSIKSDSNLLGSENGLDLVKPQLMVKTSAIKKGNTLFLELPRESITPGFWDIQSDKQKIGVLAMNQDKTESELSFYSEDELKAAFSNKPWVSVTSIKEGETASQNRITETEPVPLWKYFILGALAFFILEMVIARKGKKIKVAQ